MDRLYRVVAFSVVLTVLLVLTTSKAAEQCGQCMKNSIQCINETAYYVCPNGKDPIKKTIHKCGPNQICTSTNSICVSREKVKSTEIPCRDECQKCPTDATNVTFTCVRQTDYAICRGNKSSAIGNCPNGEYCSVEMYRKHGNICAPLCVLNFHGYEPTCVDGSLQTYSDTIAPIITYNSPIQPESLPKHNGLPALFEERKQP